MPLYHGVVAALSATSAFACSDATTAEARDTAPIRVTLPDLLLGPCDQRFAQRVIPWETRPSSRRECFRATSPSCNEFGICGTYVPCLPGETCRSAFEIDAPLGCVNLCEDAGATCTGGDSCTTKSVNWGDVFEEERVCLGGDSSDLPAYSWDGPEPAEGGLGCWTRLVAVAGPNDSPRLAVVGDHVFVLLTQLGIVADGSVIGRFRLQVAPLANTTRDTDLVTLASAESAGEDPAALTILTRLRTSGDRLLAFSRAVPSSAEVFAAIPVTSEILWGRPDTSGRVELVPSGVTVTLTSDSTALVPGSRAGCILRRDPGDLILVCFPVIADAGTERLTIQEHALAVPPAAMIDVVAMEQVHHGPAFHDIAATAAVSDRWIALAFYAGCSTATDTLSLYVAPFDAELSQPIGPWRTLSAPCGAGGPMALVGGVLLRGGLTTRLTASAEATTEPIWLAATLRGSGYPTAYDVDGDLLVTLVQTTLSGPTTSGVVLTNRVRW